MAAFSAQRQESWQKLSLGEQVSIIMMKYLPESCFRATIIKSAIFYTFAEGQDRFQVSNLMTCTMLVPHFVISKISLSTARCSQLFWQVWIDRSLKLISSFSFLSLFLWSFQMAQEPPFISSKMSKGVSRQLTLGALMQDIFLRVFKFKIASLCPAINSLISTLFDINPHGFAIPTIFPSRGLVCNSCLYPRSSSITP